MSFVLDASVALAWCFEDEQTPWALGVLDRVTELGAHAPLHWPLEVMNGLFAAERRRRIDARRRAAVSKFLQELPVRLDMDTAARAWEATARIAEKFQLTVYDAAYLELSLRRRIPLASFDQKMRAAAVSLGADVLGET